MKTHLVEILRSLLTADNITLFKMFSKKFEKPVDTECLFALLYRNRRLSDCFLDSCKESTSKSMTTFIMSFYEDMDVSKAELNDLCDIIITEELEKFLEDIHSFCCTYSPNSNALKDYITYKFVVDDSMYSYQTVKYFLYSNKITRVANYLESDILKEIGFSELEDLQSFGVYMTNPLKNNNYICIGRDSEIETCLDILCRKKKNNALLIGLPGVGKTTIVQGVCNLITSSRCPECLKGYNVYSLDVPKLISGCRYRGDLEERFTKVFNEINNNGKLVVFIDEIHQILSGNSSETPASTISDMLKPLMTDTNIHIIGATTLDEYRKIETDKALERRFSVVKVGEPNQIQTLELLKNISCNYEKFHKIKIPENILELIIKYSQKFDTHRYFPDKALDLLDNSCVYTRNHTNFDTLTEESIVNTIYRNTGIPIRNIRLGQNTFDSTVCDEIKKHIIGQEKAINSVTKMLKRNSVGLSNENKPIGSFLFVGPTGVGKTELCKRIAELHYSKESFIRFDMSEYMEKHSVSKLIGSPPGYVGYDDGGLLVERVKHNPYSVILFDEIEKAHPDVTNTLLQILDDGIISDSKGFKADFRNCIIIMTSNVGSDENSNQKCLGFGSKTTTSNDLWESAVRSRFKPEFINRIDEIIYFNYINADNVKEIIEIYLDEFRSKLLENGITLKISDSGIDYLNKICYNKEYGARFIKRSITQYVENLVVDSIIENPNSKELFLDVINESLCIKISECTK